MNAPVSMPHVMPTYGRLPIALSHGEGAYVWDTEGRRYLDGLSGIAVNTLGHKHPKLVAALQDQVTKMIHSCNYYQVPLQEELARLLVERSGLTNAFFCNSGLEANEAALKIARKFGHDKGIHRAEVIVCERAFHGRSIATLSATGNPKIHAGFEPLVEGFVRVPFNDIAALEETVATHPNVTAIFMETIQGEGGITPARIDYLQAARRVCDDKGILLMLDEVQCGMGRTGKWFGWQHAGTMPDVMTLAKGLASGVPIGACVTAGKAKGLFGPGNHGSTFGGNPLACAAALATFDTIVDDKLMDNAVAVGEAIRKGMAEALAGVSGVVDIRGRGLMIGIELDRPCGALMGRAAEQGLLLSVTAERVVRLLPALTFTAADAQTLVAMLAPMIREFLANG